MRWGPSMWMADPEAIDQPLNIYIDSIPLLLVLAHHPLIPNSSELLPESLLLISLTLIMAEGIEKRHSAASPDAISNEKQVCEGSGRMLYRGGSICS